MKKQLHEMTLQEVKAVERVIYACDYTFSDDQFIEFLDQQLSTSIDPIEVEIKDEELHIMPTRQSGLVYYFEDLIAKGEYLSGPRPFVSPLVGMFFKGVE